MRTLPAHIVLLNMSNWPRSYFMFYSKMRSCWRVSIAVVQVDYSEKTVIRLTIYTPHHLHNHSTAPETTAS